LPERIESVRSSNSTSDGNYVSNSRDISARKQRERVLRAAREQARSERDGTEAIRQLPVERTADDEIATTAGGDGTCRPLRNDTEAGTALSTEMSGVCNGIDAGSRGEARGGTGGLLPRPDRAAE